MVKEFIEKEKYNKLLDMIITDWKSLTDSYFVRRHIEKYEAMRWV